MHRSHNDSAASSLKARFVRKTCPVPARPLHHALAAAATALVVSASLMTAASSPAGATPAGTRSSTPAASVLARLSEWTIQLSTQRIGPGTTTFEITNGGSIPHAFEVEGNGIERESPQIP